MFGGPFETVTDDLKYNANFLTKINNAEDEMIKHRKNEESKHSHEVTNLQTLQTNQEIKLQQFSANIKRLERNVYLQNPHIEELTAVRNNYKIELEKMNTEFERSTIRCEKQIRDLKIKKREAAAQVDLLKKEEEKQRLLMLAVQKERDDKVAKLKKEEEEKFEYLNSVRKAQEILLLNKVKAINAEIDNVQQEIENTENGYKQLKQNHNDLQNRYFRLVDKPLNEFA